jgi:hypothetical protein
MAQRGFLAQYYHASSSKDGAYKVTTETETGSRNFTNGSMLLNITTFAYYLHSIFSSTQSHQLKLRTYTSNEISGQLQQNWKWTQTLQPPPPQIMYKTLRNAHPATPQALNTIHIIHKMVLRNFYGADSTRSSARFPLNGLQEQSARHQYNNMTRPRHTKIQRKPTPCICPSVTRNIDSSPLIYISVKGLRI